MKRLINDPPKSPAGIAETYQVSLDAVQGILRAVGTIPLAILVVEVAVSRRLPLEDALYLVKAEFVL